MKEISVCGNAALDQDVSDVNVVECGNKRIRGPLRLQTKTVPSPYQPTTSSMWFSELFAG
jgi:hypothetical protein